VRLDQVTAVNHLNRGYFRVAPLGDVSFMAYAIQAPTKWVLHSSKGDAQADDLHDESEFNEKELSDEDSEYGNGV
jgi:hypothetical protein